jgi:SagB-type dehydrogenase family enzyme
MQAAGVERILQYHDRTKHYPMRFARSAGYLDWDNQPDPFRRFDGCTAIPLPHDASDGGPDFDALYLRAGDPVREGFRRPFGLGSLGRLLELSLAITAWKSYKTSRWALRANPSSGNLHPTEGYLILPPLSDAAADAGIYHYRSDLHALERRCAFPAEWFRDLTRGFPQDAFFVGLSSIHWREAWKYGERAFRYCQHDAGHAVGALRFAAATLGWDFAVLPQPSDREVADLLGLSREVDFSGADREQPDLLGVVLPSAGDWRAAAESFPDARVVASLQSAPWSGRANRLSAERTEWDAIDAAAADATKPRTVCVAARMPQGARLEPAPRRDVAAVRVIRSRRSATAFDAKAMLPRAAFFTILDRTFPRADAAPFDAIADARNGAPRVHFALFVHRVEGLAPGLYFYLRNPASADAVRAAMRPGFEWNAVHDSRGGEPIYLLKEGPMERWAAAISCNQDIAGECCFSLGMIAEFEPVLRAEGPHAYRTLHWEAGLAGQVLYLEAEAAGFRGTGIGCFFDDDMHGLLGIRDRRLHTIYHFALGLPVLDARLETSPPYEPVR